ncbi:MAG: hypothetical protein ACTHKR_05835 [Sphingomonas sp.]
MRVVDQVRRLVDRLSPEPICDACIGERLGLSAREDAARAASELAGSDGFERRKAACALCGKTRPVIVRHDKSMA